MEGHESKPQGRVVDSDSESAPADHSSDVSKKLHLAAFSYAEVLDATKHQDDKVGQLLTSVAFLTAATIALAALEPTRLLAGKFLVPPFSLPLGLITLTVFLLGIAFAVLLLLINLSTPLRLPGLGGSRTNRSKGRDIQWAGKVEASQIYSLRSTQTAEASSNRDRAAAGSQCHAEELDRGFGAMAALAVGCRRVFNGE